MYFNWLFFKCFRRKPDYKCFIVVSKYAITIWLCNIRFRWDTLYIESFRQTSLIFQVKLRLCSSTKCMFKVPSLKRQSWGWSLERKQISHDYKRQHLSFTKYEWDIWEITWFHRKPKIRYLTLDKSVKGWKCKSIHRVDKAWLFAFFEWQVYFRFQKILSKVT